MSTPSDGSGSPWQSPDQPPPAQQPNPGPPNPQQPHSQQPEPQQPAAQQPDQQQPAAQQPVAQQPAAPTAPVGSGYGSPSSPWYGKFGQGEALPTPPQTPPGQPGQPAGNGQQGWNGHGGNRQGPGSQGWNGQGPGGQGWNGQAPNGQAPNQGWNGQAWYPQAPAGPTAVQPLGGLTPVLLAFSVLLPIVLWATALLAPNQHEAIRQFWDATTATPRPDPAPTLHLASGSTAYQIFSGLQLLVLLVTWVLGALWLTRVRQNALFLRPGGQRRSEVWPWLAWIIPVVNLWFPRQLVADTLTATAGATGERPLRTWTWWTAWLCGLFSTLALSMSVVLPVNPGLHASLAVLSGLALVTALVLWLRIVRRIAVRQEALATGRPVTTLQG